MSGLDSCRGCIRVEVGFLSGLDSCRGWIRVGQNRRRPKMNFPPSSKASPGLYEGEIENSCTEAEGEFGRLIGRGDAGR